MATENAEYTCKFIATAFFNTKESAMEEKEAITKIGVDWVSAYPVEDGWIVDFNKRLSVPEPPKGQKADFEYLIGFYEKWNESNDLGFWWDCSAVENETTGETLTEYPK